VSLELAAKINSFLAALVLLTAFAMLAQRRLNGLIHLFAWQGLLLSINTAIVGFVASRHHLYISSVLTLGLKVVLLPYILHVLIRRLKIHKEIEVVVNVPMTMMIGIALVVFSYHLTAPIMELSSMVTRSTLAVALATVLLGLLMMITRRHAVTQIVGFLALDVSRGVENELGLGVLGEKRQSALHALTPSAGPMLFQHRLLAVVGHGVEVEVDDRSIIEAQARRLLHEGVLKPREVGLIEGVGVGRERGALGKHIQAGKQPQRGIEGVLAHMGVALGAEQLQGQKGQHIVQGREDLGAWQPGSAHHLREVQLDQEGGEEKHPGGGRIHLVPLDLTDRDPLGALGDRSPLDGQAELEPRAARQPRQPLLGDHPLHRPHRELHALFAEELGDLAGGEPVLAPGDDLVSHLGADPAASGARLGTGLGEVDLAVSELVAQQAHVAGGEAEAFGDEPGGHALHEGGTQGLIAALPGADGAGEERRIAHER